MPTPDPATVAIIDAIAKNTLDYALLLAAIGTLSMAFIELVKGVFALRRRFHRRQVERWVSDTSARHELLVLATGGERYANVLFDLPVERMMGQIQAAANLSLEFPDRYPHVYAFFTRDDLEIAASDSGRWARYAEASAQSGMTGAAQDSETRAAQQARVRLGNLIARRLDSFQNRTQYLWARYNQFAAIGVGAGLSIFALNQGTTLKELPDFLLLVGLSLLAGVLAPFAKDVVSAVSGLRTKA